MELKKRRNGIGKPLGAASGARRKLGLEKMKEPG